MNVHKRQDIERRLIHHLIRVMKAHGWRAIEVDDGGDEYVKTRGLEKKVMEAVFSVDESRIIFENANGVRHCAIIVLGNSGWDAVSDYGFRADDNFREIMERGVDPYVDKLELECV